MGHVRPEIEGDFSDTRQCINEVDTNDGKE